MARSDAAQIAMSGRKGERLLRGGDAHVDAELVHFDLYPCHGADGIHEPEDIGVFLPDFRDFFDRVHDAGGGFVVCDGKDVILAGCERLVHHFRRRGLAPLRFDLVGRDIVCFGHFEPPVAEGADGEHAGALCGKGTDGAFHQSRSGGRGEQDRVCRVEHLAHLLADFPLQLGCFLPPVADHRCGHLLENVRGDFCGTRDEQFLMHGTSLRM